MNALINSVIKHPLFRTGAVMVGILLLILLLMFGVPRGWNKFSNWWWQGGTEKLKQEADAASAEAQKWKGVTEELVKELEEAKQLYAEEKTKREAAEKILSEKRLATEAARDAYERAISAPAPTPDLSGSTDDLCERARRLGVSCQ